MKILVSNHKKAIISTLLAFICSAGFSQEKSVFELEKIENSSERKEPNVASSPASAVEINLEKNESDVLFVQEEEPIYKESNSLQFTRWVQTRKYELIEKSLESGMDVNTDLMLGNTMLHLGAMHNDLKMVMLALKYDAKITSNKDGETPIHWAAASGNVTMLKAMLPIKDSTSYLNKKSKRGRNALHFCILYSKSEGMLRYLLRNQADIMATDENLQTPLHYSVVLDKVDFSMILLANNANIQSLDKNKESAESYMLTKFDSLSLLKVSDYLSPSIQNDLKDKNKFTSNIWKDVIILE